MTSFFRMVNDELAVRPPTTHDTMFSRMKLIEYTWLYNLRFENVMGMQNVLVSCMWGAMYMKIGTTTTMVSRNVKETNWNFEELLYGPDVEHDFDE